MTSQPTKMVSQVKLAATGVDEQAGIVLTNREGKWQHLTLSLRQTTKRGTSLMTRAHIELSQIPRVGKSGHHLYGRWITRSDRNRRNHKALQYEVLDMEAVAGRKNHLYLTTAVSWTRMSTPQDWGLVLQKKNKWKETGTKS